MRIARDWKIVEDKITFANSVYKLVECGTGAFVATYMSKETAQLLLRAHHMETDSPQLVLEQIAVNWHYFGPQKEFHKGTFPECTAESCRDARTALALID
jgi:hypothetical protein